MTKRKNKLFIYWFFFVKILLRCLPMFHAQLKLVCPDTERFIRYENLSSCSLEDLNRNVDTRMRELRPVAIVVHVKYWEDSFKWFKEKDYGSD